MNYTGLVLLHRVEVDDDDESEAWASHQVARRSVLIVNELGYEMRL